MTTTSKSSIKTIKRLSVPKLYQYCKDFDKLISARTTGTLEALADKFRISETLAVEILSYMIEHLNCPIDYCQTDRTYFYRGGGSLMMDYIQFEE